MSKHRALKIGVASAASFAGLAGTIVYLWVARIVSYEMAMLMLVALLGLYIGFGVLIAIYRLVAKLE